MRTLLAAALALCLSACGGVPNDLSDPGPDVSALSGCGFLKPAHCFCKVVGGPQMTDSPDHLIIDGHVEGMDLFTYVIPGKCYNQQVDWANSHFDQGCWRDCRDAFGIAGHAQPAETLALMNDAAKKIRAHGACGGWNSAPLEFAAGANKYRSAAGMGLGLGTGGTVVVVNGVKTCQ